MAKIDADFNRYVSERIDQIATEELEKARERMKLRIPELAAEITVTLQQYYEKNGMEAVLQIVVKPRL